MCHSSILPRRDTEWTCLQGSYVQHVAGLLLRNSKMQEISSSELRSANDNMTSLPASSIDCRSLIITPLPQIMSHLALTISVGCISSLGVWSSKGHWLNINLKKSRDYSIVYSSWNDQSRFWRKCSERLADQTLQTVIRLLLRSSLIRVCTVCL